MGMHFGEVGEKDPGFLFLYSNVNSLINKLEEIQIYVIRNNIKLLLFVETWLNEDVTDEEIHIEGYNSIRKDRSNKKGGGIIAYIADDIKYTELSMLMTSNTELLWFDIKIGSMKLLFCLCYRPPNNIKNNDKEILECLAQGGNYLEKQGYRDFILLGDFNLPKIKWQKLVCNMESTTFKNCFIKFIINNLLQQHIKGNTRYRNSSSSELDLVFSKNAKLFKKIIYEAPMGKSDHITIKLELDLDGKTADIQTSYIDFKNANYDKIKEELFQINLLNKFIDKKMIENDFLNVYNQIILIMHKNIKIKKRKKMIYKQKWLNADILKEIRKRNQLFNKALRTGKAEDYKTYKCKRNQINTLRTKGRKNFEQNLFQKAKYDSGKAIFGYLKKKKKENIDKLIKENHVVMDAIKKGNLLSEHFTRFNGNNRQIAIINNNDLNDNIEMVTEEIVEKIINNLKDSIAKSEDIITTYFIKRCKGFFVKFLVKFINISFRTGFIPDIWKISHVWPKYKGGNREDVAAYRPISMVSSLSKIMEKVVLQRMQAFIETHNLLLDYQHGFHKGFSTATNLLSFSNQIINNFEESVATDVIYLDISAAFDSVDHKILIGKLKLMNLPGYLIRWVDNFLSNRFLRTMVDNCLSDKFYINKGVSQGAVLSATLFNLYMADISKISSSMFIYADDIKILRKINNEQDSKCLQEDLIIIEKWCSSNKLTLCVNKTEILHIGKKNAKYCYMLNGNYIKPKNEHKDLGVMFDDKYDFSSHVGYISNKIRKKFGWIKNNFKFLSADSFTILYKSIIQPIIDYNSIGIVLINEREFTMLENLFRSLSKKITGWNKLEYKDRLKRLKLLTPRMRYTFNDLVFMFREIVLKNNLNGYFIKSERAVRKGHSYQLKNIFRFTKKKDSSIFCRGIKHWNKLPANCINTQNLKVFKALTFEYLYSHQ